MCAGGVCVARLVDYENGSRRRELIGKKKGKGVWLGNKNCMRGLKFDTMEEGEWKRQERGEQVAFKLNGRGVSVVRTVRGNGGRRGIERKRGLCAAL